MSPIFISGNWFERERIWSSFRREHDLRTDAFVTLDAFNNAVQGHIGKDKRLQNLGAEGRRLLMEVARGDFEQMPTEQRERNVLIMKARGLITKDEFDIFMSQLGITRGAAEYRYRKFLRGEQIMFELSYKNLLKYGELTKLLKGRRLTYGQFYYRSRKYYAQTYGLSFRGWEKRQTGKGKLEK